jgi:hypothetical protein
MFYFKCWFTPVLIKPLCYLGSVASIIWGLYLIVTNSPHQSTAPDGPAATVTTYYPADWHLVGLGCAWVLGSPICLRIICETVATIFLLREATERREAERDESQAVAV